MDLKEYIPFEKKGFRPGQEEAIIDILESIDDGNRFTILNAPVGVGKSLIGYVISKKLAEKHNSDTYMCTGTKLLQSQYINDFKDVKTIKGRMNFECNTEPLFDCSKGMCQTHSKFACNYKPILKDTWYYKKNPLSSSDLDLIDDMCPYWKQKVEGIMHPITMLNYDYLLSDIRFVQHLPFRKLLICDEGHNIEKILMRQLETTFSPSAVEREVGYKFKMVSTIQDWLPQLEMVADLYLEKMKKTKSDTVKKKMQEKYAKFSELFFLLEDNPSNWVFIQDQVNGHLFYTFKPIIISDYSQMIFGIAENVLIMTGTILKQDIFARDLGITDFKYIEVPSIIPSSNRPIIKRYVGSMATSSVDKTMPNMIAEIKMLADEHSDEKGVIHTFTYKIARAFQNAFSYSDRFMFHDQYNKEKVFRKFKEDNTNKILVSPVAFEGVDFPYDQARWQCICKEPFPNMRDPQISIRDSIDYDWVFRQRCLVLSQMYGRTNRAPDDYSVTYLLDSRIETLLGPSSLVTDYFLEALDGLRYEDELILKENAFDKLTKDNSRKTHEFDREVERAVLNDIQDGYNSLSSLRREYKKFSSDAYKYITPAVERLLKHGAIEYK